METTRSIRRGDEIVQEMPLMYLPPSLMELYDETTFMVPRAERNGLQTFQDKYDAMSAPDKLRFMGLYNAHAGNAQAGNDILDRFRTNAFMEEEKLQGHNFQFLRVYDNISKVNHSCRPNAVLSYDPNTKTGSLRALSNINQDEGIFVNYRAREEFTLSNETARMNTLRDNYRFNCDCAACSSTGNALRIDSDSRAMALQLFRQISPAYTAYANDRAKDTDLTERRKRTDDYITRLRGLQISDGKLVWAYKTLSDVHIEIFKLLRTYPHQCQFCRGEPNEPLAHIEAAQDALIRRLTYNIGMCGSDHPDV